MKSLLIYSSTDGQTKKICEAIKEYSPNKDFVLIHSLEEALNLDIKNYEQIVLGASI